MRAGDASPARDICRTTRRALLAAGAAFASLGLSRAAAAQTAPRLAAIDWAMLETALALGVAPVAATELLLFRKTAVEPFVPEAVADLGLRGALSYEQLYASRPDLILSSPWYENRAHVLSRIAPVASFSIYEPGRPPYDLAAAATRALGERIGLSDEASRVVAEADAELDAARARLLPLAGRPVLVMNLADARHFRAFGADSMFGDVARRLRLGLAWAEPTRFGAYPTVGVEALAGMTEAIVVNVGPTSPSALAEMRASPLWRAMPPIAKGRFIDLEPVNPYGALPAARRFARLASEALQPLADG
ncbi:ABC transporter substrate-binding protein [Hansschlegelia zhihuaiae]|uniref:Iron-siderophore ABC transporter substrate-binding protein n=1 Tax=Hansschlegelia zhihuaiae TaxID=405005 RepID=A0A4Q0MCS1_9HYPH|nr:iron-siderophore ABC transporter substrate-binding protein [Hansschlegelia zhihuaiae]